MPKWLAPAMLIAMSAAIVLGSMSESLKLALHTHGQLHPWVHLFAFALAGFCGMLSVRRPWLRLMVLLSLLLLGWGTEYREHLQDGWPVEASDVQTDCAGIALGTLSGWLVTRRRPTPRT